jgi:hypothetical protein
VNSGVSGNFGKSLTRIIQRFQFFAYNVIEQRREEKYGQCQRRQKWHLAVTDRERRSKIAVANKTDDFPFFYNRRHKFKNLSAGMQ